MTTTAKQTLAGALDDANLNQIAAVLKKIKLGTMLTVIDQTITLTAVANSVDLSVLGAAKAALVVRSVRVTDVSGGSASAGIRTVGDASCTPSATLVKLSADGVTLTFEGTIKAVRVVYLPVPYTDLTDDYAPQS